MATMEEYLREMELRAARGWTPGVPSRFTAPVSGTWNLPTTARTTMRQVLPRFNLGDIAAASADPVRKQGVGRPRLTPEEIQRTASRQGTGTIGKTVKALAPFAKVAGPVGVAYEALRSEPAVASELPPGVTPGDFRVTQAYPSMNVDDPNTPAVETYPNVSTLPSFDISPDAGGAVGGYPAVDYGQMAQDWGDPTMMSAPTDPTGGLIDIDALAGRFSAGPTSTTQVGGIPSGGRFDLAQPNWRDQALAEAQALYGPGSPNEDEMDLIDAWKDTTPGYSLSATLRDIVQPSGYEARRMMGIEDSGDSLAVSPQTDQDYLDEGTIPPGDDLDYTRFLDEQYGGPALDASQAGTGFSTATGAGGFTGGAQLYDMGMDPTHPNTGGLGTTTTVDLLPFAAAALPFSPALTAGGKVVGAGYSALAKELAATGMFSQARRDFMKQVTAATAAVGAGLSPIGKTLETITKAVKEKFTPHLGDVNVIPIQDKFGRIIDVNVVSVKDKAGQIARRKFEESQTGFKPGAKTPKEVQDKIKSVEKSIQQAKQKVTPGKTAEEIQAQKWGPLAVTPAVDIQRDKQAAINERLAQQATARQQQQAQAAQAAQAAEVQAAIDRVAAAQEVQRFMQTRDYQEEGAELTPAMMDALAAGQVDTFAGYGGPMSAAEINVAGGMEFGGAGGMAGSDRGGGRGGPGGRGR